MAIDHGSRSPCGRFWAHVGPSGCLIGPIDRCASSCGVGRLFPVPESTSHRRGVDTTLTSTFRSRVKRAAVTSLAGTILPGGVGLGVQQASATTSGSPAVLANDQDGTWTAGDISATDWETIARQAEAAGDREGAQAAREASQQKDSGQEGWWSLGKKALKALLKYGRSYVQAKFRPWRDKLYDLVDFMDTSGELAIATLLINNGIPADNAFDIARWIMMIV